MRFLIPLSIVIVACAAAAGAGSGLPAGPRDAGVRVTVDGYTYTLRADLHRDLMPGPEPTPRRGLGGTIFLRAEVEGNAPAGIRAVRAWLVNGREVWETVPQPLQTLTVDKRYHLSLGISDGPPWDAGREVDIILEFATSTGSYFIGDRAVEIVGAY